MNPPFGGKLRPRYTRCSEWCQSKTESEYKIAGLWVVPSARRRSQDLDPTGEAAATHHPMCTRVARSRRIDREAAGVRAMIVRAPFPNIAEHVVKTPGVGLQESNAFGSRAGIFAKPSEVGQIAPTHAFATARATRVLPLRLRG